MMEKIKEPKIVVIGLSGESVFLTCDHFNQKGETVNVQTKFVEPGGKGYNQALCLGKLGADVSFITAFGMEENIQFNCLDVLTKNNVKVYPIYKNCPSSYAVIQTNKDGENNVMVYGGASEMITFSDIMMFSEVIQRADILLLQLEYPYEATKQVIDYANSLGIKIILNPAPSRYLDEEVLSKISMITPNEFELLHMTKTEDVVDALKQLPISQIVCTRGEKEILYKEGEVINRIMVQKVTPVDTTGAGDIFNAYLTFYLNKKPLMETIELSSCASTLSVLKRGVLEAIPRLDEVETFWNNRKIKGYRG